MTLKRNRLSIKKTFPIMLIIGRKYIFGLIGLLTHQYKHFSEVGLIIHQPFIFLKIGRLNQSTGIE